MLVIYYHRAFETKGASNWILLSPAQGEKTTTTTNADINLIQDLRMISLTSVLIRQIQMMYQPLIICIYFFVGVSNNSVFVAVSVFYLWHDCDRWVSNSGNAVDKWIWLCVGCGLEQMSKFACLRPDFIVFTSNHITPFSFILLFD